MSHHYHSFFSILVQTDDDAGTDLSVSSTKEEDYAISLNGDDILWEEYSSVKYNFVYVSLPFFFLFVKFHFFR